MKHLLRNTGYFLPLGIFLVLILIFWQGLSLDPRKLPSTLINHPAPAFNSPMLFNPKQRFTDKDLLGHVSLINVWATWCSACQAEHAILLALAHKEKLAIYGFDYKDKRDQAIAWLRHAGNPYQAIAFDAEGKVGMDWGVYGTPETYVVDQRGIIRYKHIGPLTPQVWRETISPLIAKLNTAV